MSRGRPVPPAALRTRRRRRFKPLPAPRSANGSAALCPHPHAEDVSRALIGRCAEARPRPTGEGPALPRPVPAALRRAAPPLDERTRCRQSAAGSARLGKAGGVNRARSGPAGATGATGRGAARRSGAPAPSGPRRRGPRRFPPAPRAPPRPITAGAHSGPMGSAVPRSGFTFSAGQWRARPESRQPMGGARRVTAGQWEPPTLPCRGAGGGDLPAAA